MACVRNRRGKWCLDYRDQDGKRRWETTDLNKKEANLLLAQRIQEIGKGEFQSTGDQYNFDQLVDAFTDGHIVNVRDTTAKDYKGNINRHILPYFKGWKIRTVTMQHVEAYRADMQSNGIGQRTTNKCLTILSMMFRYALKHRWINYNPAAEVKKLKDTGEHKADLVESSILAPLEIQKLIAAANDKWAEIIKTAIFTGMRQGELLALQWGDIDWNSKQIHVRRSCSYGKFYEPKTKNSRRKIDIPEQLILSLKKWKLVCLKSELDLVFPNTTGKPINHGNLLRQGFYPALRRAGLRKIRFHDLRHTYASLLIANKEEPKKIQMLMGHASITITYDVYGHLIPNASDGIAERLADFALDGSSLVADDLIESEDKSQVIDLMVAGPGIEPGTRGFSILCSTD